MFSARDEALPDHEGRRVRFQEDAGDMTFESVLIGWRKDEGFRAVFSEALAACPYPAFRLELPPVDRESLGRPFECVLLSSTWLDTTPSALAFEEHFSSRTESVLTFPNLGHDAILVVPRPEGPAHNYGHLAAFLRGASAAQVQTLWKAVGSAAQRRISDRPLWISTHGGGVPWLHVRLDDRPKYYGYRPFCRAEPGRRS